MFVEDVDELVVMEVDVEEDEDVVDTGADVVETEDIEVDGIDVVGVETELVLLVEVVVVEECVDSASAAAPAMTMIMTITIATIALLIADTFTTLFFILEGEPFSSRVLNRYLGFATIGRSKTLGRNS